VGLILFKWLLPAMFSWHPFYVSVTEIEHVKAKKEVQVSCRIFADDLEMVLRKESKLPLDIIHPASKPKMDSLIAGYISRHLTINIDGKAVKLSYLGYKIEEEAAWCFLAAENIPSFNQVKVKDDILYSEHANQINMIHVIRDGVRKSNKLDNPKADVSVSF
jgi:phosphosulfolactate phosphohydrolase-like enzyme